MNSINQYNQMIDSLTERGYYKRKNFAIGGRTNFSYGSIPETLQDLITNKKTTYTNLSDLKKAVEAKVGKKIGGSFSSTNNIYGDLIKQFNFTSPMIKTNQGDPEDYILNKKQVNDLKIKLEKLNKKYNLSDKGVKFVTSTTKQGNTSVVLSYQANNYRNANLNKSSRAPTAKGIKELENELKNFQETDLYKNYDKSAQMKAGGVKSSITQLENAGSKQHLIFDYVLDSKKDVTVKDIAKKFKITQEAAKKDLFSLYENIYKRAGDSGGVFLPDDLDKLNNVRDKLKNSDTDLRKNTVLKLVTDAYQGNEEKLKPVLDKVRKFYTLQGKLPDKYQKFFKSNLDHIIPMNFLSQVKGGVDPIDLIRVSPLPEFLNQRAFKSQLDDVFGTAIKNKDKETLKTISEIQQYLPQELGGITTGGKVKNYVVEPLDLNRSLTQQQAKTKQVYNRVLKFIDDPKVGELLQKIGINPETAFQALRGSGQLIRKNIPGFLNTFKQILNRHPELRVQLGDDFSEIENQYASLNTGTMSDVSPVKKENSVRENAPAIAGGAALLGRYGKPFLKNAFRTVGSPVVSGGFAVNEMMSEDPNMALAGAELLLPEIYKQAGNKIPKGFINNVLGLQGIKTLVDKYPMLRKFKPVANLIAKSPRVMTPTGLTLIAKDIYDEFDKTIGFDQRGPLTEEELLEMREKETYMGSIADAFDKAYKENTPLPGQEGIKTLKESFAVGGRVGFADGPEDPSKRKFMKIMGGLASLPIVGRFFDIGTQAPKVAEVVKRSAEGIPDFINDLIAKVKLKAEVTGMKYFTGNRSDEFKDVYQADNYVVTEQGNKTIIREVDQDGDMLYKENQMEIDYDPETGGYTYNEASARPDAEGKLKDVEEYIEEDDLENMRKYTYDE